MSATRHRRKTGRPIVPMDVTLHPQPFKTNPMLAFDNRFTAELPADTITENVRHQVQGALFSRVQPTPVAAPYLVAYAQEVAADLGLDETQMQSPEMLTVLAGNSLLTGMDPHATCYGGHQFGNWVGQLGDGRAINLGEVNRGDRHFMLQLKGAGPTPFSRTADGLAVMRSSVREFLCSEAMFHLGVPTTRALSLVGTGEAVMRDMLYDGNPAPEPGAVVCRVSSSFVRFGHFQMLLARQEFDLLRQFTDFVIRREYPHLLTKTSEISKETYIAFFNEVCQRTALLMVHWMRVGFVHGVMNTDNMSILGETIDYGPYGWLEDFDPDWTPNTTDAGQRRYRYSQQPAIAQWNLMQLANALVPLLDDDTKPLEEALSVYAKSYEQQWQHMMAAKLGLTEYKADLVDGLMTLLTRAETDMTVFFRTLADIEPDAFDSALRLRAAGYVKDQQDDAQLAATEQWLDRYSDEIKRQGIKDRRARMHKVNPKYVLRNYLAQLAIDDAEQGDFAKVNELLEVLRRPYDEQPEYEQYAAMRPDWARTRVGCSMLSCSS